MIAKENIQEIYELSPMQKGMLVSYALDPSTLAYIEQFDFKICGDVDPQKLEWALDKVSERYDILRTVFSYKKTSSPRQVVLKSWDPKMIISDLRNKEDVETLVEDFKQTDKQKGFDISADVLVRGALLHTEDKVWHFILTFHHILMDGWSLTPVLKALIYFYEMADKADELSIVDEVHPYREYIQWHKQQDENAAKEYWMKYLDGYEKSARIPMFGSGEAYLHATKRFELPEELSQEMRLLATQNNITLNTIFQTAWGILLQKFNNTDDVVFGSVISGRSPHISGIESMVGLFINTQPLRVKTAKGDDFKSLCLKVHRNIFSSTQFEYYSLYDIQSGNILKNNLVNHVIAFENYPLAEQLRDIGSKQGQSLWFEDVKVFEQTSYDLHVVVNPGDKIAVSFVYNANKYLNETMDILERSIQLILKKACNNPNMLIEDLCIAAQQDMLLVLDRFNDTQHDYPVEETVDGIFKKNAEKHPSNIAIRWRDENLTYGELDAWSDVLMQKMQEKGVGKGSFVGLLFSHCPEMIASMLGILKAGATYVPLDVKDSKERLQFLIQDADVKLVCTCTDYVLLIPTDADVLTLDDMPRDSGQERPEIRQSIEAPAYLMYTSGTTGNPKGCLITHRNILRLVFGQDYFDFGSHQVILQTGSLAFDASTFEIWGALLHNAALVLISETDILEAEKLHEQLVKNEVQSMWLTAALFNQLCDQNPHIFSKLNTLLVGGDTLSIKHIEKAKLANPGLRIVNGYGPTENTTFSTTHTVTEQDFTRTRIPIGRPIANSSAYILDSGMNLLPIGAIGELCVGGDGVGLGYHNRMELTKQKFIKNPFIENGRLYRTGDFARWLPGGTIDFLGRIDNQIKIRGYRVELEEIERVIEGIPNIKSAAVVSVNRGQVDQLCAFYVKNQDIQVQDIKNILKEKLPIYMVPTIITEIDSLPLNRNGKIDRLALAQYKITIPARETGVALPSNEMERTISDVITSVLGIETVGVFDNFFEIGANSLSLIAINNQLKQKLSREIPLVTLFEYTNITRLSEYLTAVDDEQQKSEEKERKEITDAKAILTRSSLLLKKMGGDEHEREDRI